MGFPFGASGKEPTCQCRRHKRCEFDRWVGKIPKRRAWKPTQIFLLGNLMYRGPWRSIVNRVTKSQTWLKQLSTHVHAYKNTICMHALIDKCMVVVKSLSCVRLFATPWTVAYHGILQARILEWVTISFSRGSSRPRDRTRVSRIGGRRFNLWATREAHISK